MPRKGKRVTVTKNVYRDAGGYEVRVVVGGHPYSARMPPDSTLAELKAKRDALKDEGKAISPRATSGTLRADVPKYLKLIQHLASADDREDHLNAWIERLGDVYRYRIAPADILAARVQWLTVGRPSRPKQGKRRKVHTGPLSPKTINHYCDTLRHLYRTLDGQKTTTPVDDVPHLPVPRTPIQRVPDATMIAVDQALAARERAGLLPDAKTRARFRVLVSTGKRPCEVMRALPSDVNLTARVWIPRDAKGGYTPGVYLNADMLAAWQLFVEADAWGEFSHGSFVRSVRAAGWPAGVRFYQARHTTWITASERGIDLHDIAAGAGHTDPRMTRRMYVWRVMDRESGTVSAPDVLSR
jgi:integrase